MRWGKLALFSLVLGGILVFTFFFKDRLLERALERGLEAVFHARSDATGLKVQLLRTRIVLEHLEVADEEKPLKNLFELGRTEISLDPGQLLRGKVVIENVECRQIQWNTNRKSSGELPASAGAGAGAGAGAKKAEAAIPTLASSFMELIRFEAGEVLERNRQKLQSPGRVEAFQAALEKAAPAWKERTDRLGSELDKTGEGLAALQKIDFSRIKTLEEAKSEYQRVETAVSQIQTLRRQVEEAGSGIRKELQDAERLSREARAALEKDSAFLKGLVRLPEGGLKGFTAGLVEALLQDKVGGLTNIARRAVLYAGRLKKPGAPSKPPRPSRRQGTDVPFPSRIYPDFLLKHFGVSMGEAASTSFSLSFELRDLASEPDLWDRPTTFEAGWNREGARLEASGALDLRRSAGEIFRLKLKGGLFPFGVKEGLEWIGMEELSGRYSLEAGLSTKPDRRISGKLAAEAQQVSTVPRPGGEPGLLARLLAETLAAVKTLSLQVGFEVRQPGDRLELSIASGLDDEFGARLRGRAGEFLKQYQDQLTQALTKELQPLLSKSGELRKGLEQEGKTLASAQGRVESFQQVVDSKKKEYQAALTRLGGSLQKQAGEAAKKLKLPGF